MATDPQTIHATCIRIGPAGILLTGPSGVGKSDLALRLIDAGARLVADDRVVLQTGTPDAPWPVASAPEALCGLIEVRGVGILRTEVSAPAAVRLAVRLHPPGSRIERLPEPDFITLAGIAVPVIDLVAVEPSAPAKLRAALAAVLDPLQRHT
ncbi:HPr kinase/phosphatase C-terminal domain-containing protein [Tistrella mobilis]|uniref:HPr kinase/phosphorylase n=1 Tax=Tistrella mobilis TaxID=171437 RepID=UPI003556EBC3